MCSTTKPVLGLLPPIEHDDPGDDSRYLDMPRDEIVFGADPYALVDVDTRPSTAPHADLERRVAQLEEEIEALTLRGSNHLKAIDYADERIDALFGRTDKLALTLARLAVAHVALRKQLEQSWSRRLGAWFREHVYSSRAR